MNYEQNLLLAISLVGFLAVAVWTAMRSGQWRKFLFLVMSVFLFGLVLHQIFGFPKPGSDVTAKGSGERPLAVTAALYLCMVAGMLAQYLYANLMLAKRSRKKWDWGNFLGPVLASPIVFIPLQGALLGAGVDLSAQVQPRIMLFLVAFENGFFWRDFFDRQRRGAAKDVELAVKE